MSDKALITKICFIINYNYCGQFSYLVNAVINLMTAPNENKQINASLVLNRSSILAEVVSLYQIMFASLFENFSGQKSSRGKLFNHANLIPFLVIAKIEIFSTLDPPNCDKIPY